jgi:isocitrate dehydrogenase
MGKNIANPTALLLSGIGMLRHFGLMKASAIIENALLYTLESGVHTGDFGQKGTTSVNTTEFANAIIGNFGKNPEHNPKPILEDKEITPTIFKLEKNPMLEGEDHSSIDIVGVDFFIESIEQPKEVADKCLQHTLNLFKLVTISNRGTQVWPSGSVFTNLINQYRCRFESIGDVPITQVDVLELYKRLMQDFKVCSLELLNVWGGKKAYSLAQGQ